MILKIHPENPNPRLISKVIECIRDGGIIVSNNKDLTDNLKLIRNHGLINRDTCVKFAYNSRLDTIQAVVAKHLIEKRLDNITNSRISNAYLYDKLLSDIPSLNIAKRIKGNKEVFHLYHINVKKRDALQKFLIKNNIDAKIHYPIPVHLQQAAKFLKYKKGDFPVSEKLAKTSLSLPVHEFIGKREINHMASKIDKFYKDR